MGVRNWTQRYVAWLRQLQFEHLPDQVVFAEYVAEVTAAGERIKRLEAALHQCAQSSSQVALIRPAGLPRYRLLSRHARGRSW